ncbi:MAG: FtsW/RodA/SpoVE family cell cycle protein, partial [Clostridia bacterium]|nr:FtsW/RodA/SpoVE family cell cycle protein [Clostridia bacterium]
MASSEQGRQPVLKKRRKFFYIAHNFDVPLLLVLLVLLTIGLTCMFSASYAYSYYQNDGDSYLYIRKQLIFAAVGLAAMFLFSIIDYRIWHKLSLPVLGVAVLLLIIVLLIPSSDGVQRWLALPIIPPFQPSEVGKFAVILTFAHLISLNHKAMKSFLKGYLPFMAVLAVICVLVLREPHLSGTILIFGIGIMMMYAGGTRPLYLIMTIVIAVAAVLFVVFVLQYERDRIDVW